MYRLVFRMPDNIPQALSPKILHVSLPANIRIWIWRPSPCNIQDKPILILSPSSEIGWSSDVVEELRPESALFLQTLCPTGHHWLVDEGILPHETIS